MPGLEHYRKGLDYSYAPGLFPSLEVIIKRPELVRRVLISSKLADTAATEELLTLCKSHGIRTELADRILSRLSGKDNVFAAAVFRKESADLSLKARHLVLHHPTDKGNLGTILRTASGFGFADIAIIHPAADYFDPHVIRASMGALFSLHIKSYDHFDEYRAEHPDRDLFPFMLTGAVSPEQAALTVNGPYTLIMGSEGSGLPEEFASFGQAVRIPHSDSIDSLNLSVAAGIGMYVFSKHSTL